MTVNAAEETMWFPGPDYRGRVHDPLYNQKISQIRLDDLVDLVTRRAQEDGEWSIEQDLVGDNEDKMRKFMEFVSDRKNIQQCTAHIYKEGAEEERTVDWVCRELADASKVMVK